MGMGSARSSHKRKERCDMKWDVELFYGIGFTVTDIEANTREEAITKAKAIVEETTIMEGPQVSAGDLEFDQCTYTQEHR